jgi:hypothetical protein
MDGAAVVLIVGMMCSLIDNETSQPLIFGCAVFRPVPIYTPLSLFPFGGE